MIFLIGRSLSFIRARRRLPNFFCLARSGIDFQAGLAQRARSGIVAGAKASASRVRRLAPLSAFGRGEPAVEQRGLKRT